MLKTFETLPKRCLQHVELWVRPEEVKAYKAEWYANKVKKIFVWPDEIDCIAKKRKWLGDVYDKNFTLIDDDLSMYVWHPKMSKYVQASHAEKRFEREFLERFPSLFEDHWSASVPMKLFSDQKAKLLTEKTGKLISHDQLGYVFSGYRKGSLRNLRHRTFVFTDLSLSIQAYKKTKSSVVYYGMCFQQSGAKELANTGVGTYRTDLVKKSEALKMMNLYPGIVTGFKANKVENGGGITIEKRMSRLKTGVKEEHIEKTLDKLEEILEQNGLFKVPKRFEIEFSTPRAEIERMIKKYWKEAKK